MHQEAEIIIGKDPAHGRCITTFQAVIAQDHALQIDQAPAGDLYFLAPLGRWQSRIKESVDQQGAFALHVLDRAGLR